MRRSRKGIDRDPANNNPGLQHAEPCQIVAQSAGSHWSQYPFLASRSYVFHILYSSHRYRFFSGTFRGCFRPSDLVKLTICQSDL